MLEEEFNDPDINSSKMENQISNYIENNQTSNLTDLIKTKLSKTDIINMKFGHNQESILHRLVIMDIKILFINSFDVLKSKFEKNEFTSFINYQDQQGNTSLLEIIS